MEMKERHQLVVSALRHRSETDPDILSHEEMADGLLEALDKDYCPRTKSWLKVMGFKNLAEVRDALTKAGLGK